MDQGASSSTDNKPTVINLDDVLNQFMTNQKNMCMLIAELFKRSEKAYELVTRFEQYENFDNKLKRKHE